MKLFTRALVLTLVVLLGVCFVAPPASGSPDGSGPIIVGLFLPEGPTGEQTARGARMAAEEINRAGGIHGRPLRLVTAASDGPWEGVSRELVRLIYGRKATAVIGALDGRTAHVAEQVITRARGEAVFLTPWSSEDSLTRIGIPWFFQLVPDDRRQGRDLAREVLGTAPGSIAAIWAGEDFDSRSVTAGLRRWMPAAAARVFPSGRDGAAADLAHRIREGEIGSVVLAAPARPSAELIALLSREGLSVPLFATLRLATDEFLARVGSEAAAIRFPAPRCGIGAKDIRDRFYDEYRRRFLTHPGLPALFGHDAVMAVAEAFRRAGGDGGEELAAALGSSSVTGVTGPIRFDGRRGRDLDLEWTRPGPAGGIDPCRRSGTEPPREES